MGGNGGKWGEMGENGGNWGEMGEMGCYGGRWGQITKSVGLGWTGLVSPFSPIFPHFSLEAFANAPPPPIALLPIKTMFFDLFSPQNSPFFHRASKISHTFPQFPPFFLNQPISDKCTVTFQKRVFLRPAVGLGVWANTHNCRTMIEPLTLTPTPCPCPCPLPVPPMSSPGDCLSRGQHSNWVRAAAGRGGGSTHAAQHHAGAGHTSGEGTGSPRGG